MFDFLNPLTTDDFNENVEFLYPQFLPKKQITMIYADGGMGKSWLLFGLAKYATEHNSATPQGAMKVLYIDVDNPISVLKERGIEHKLLNVCEGLTYCHRSKFDGEPMDLLDELEKRAFGDAYRNTLVLLDSIRDFADVNNDLAAMRVGNKLKNIRDAGATIIVLHHSTKNGSNYQGSNNLRNSVDNMYRLMKADAPDGEIRWLLEVKKERAAISDIALTLNTQNLFIAELDVEEVKLNDDDKDFIDKVKTVLKERGEMNKTELLKACGHKKDDKTARVRLDRFDGIHWQSAKTKGVYTYGLT
ncbi:AAA family ATPase [uncultured Methylophaga sp.]|uniref:AAA family ATPase n=1 Tax=uncultured Methylophaga sp. TaxID=285271 RepID=UPI00260A977F|nr:AAA family ATPase [uncultured Methylophaga sp.]